MLIERLLAVPRISSIAAASWASSVGLLFRPAGQNRQAGSPPPSWDGGACGNSDPGTLPSSSTAAAMAAAMSVLSEDLLEECSESQSSFPADCSISMGLPATELGDLSRNGSIALAPPFIMPQPDFPAHDYPGQTDAVNSWATATATAAEAALEPLERTPSSPAHGPIDSLPISRGGGCGVLSPRDSISARMGA